MRKRLAGYTSINCKHLQHMCFTRTLRQSILHQAEFLSRYYSAQHQLIVKCMASYYSVTSSF